MKKLLFLFVFFALIIPQQGFAQDNPQTTPPSDTSVKLENRHEKTEGMNTAQGKKGQIRSTFQANTANLEPTIQAERLLMQQKFQARRDAFKEKLKTLTDEKKKIIAERVDTKLASINQKRTDQMTQNLKQLDEILTKLKTKRDTASANGKDVSTINTAITAAETAIAAAKTAVAAQAGKDYTAQITDTSTLKQSMGTVTKQLQTDLTATHKTVVDAKLAVYEVAKATWKMNGTVIPTKEPVAIPTAEPTP